MRRKEKLVLMPSLTAEFRSDGSFQLKRKFIQGVVEMDRVWRQATGDEVEVWVESGSRPQNLDEEWIHPSQLPCAVRHIDYETTPLFPLLEDVRVVLGTTSHRQNQMAERVQEQGVPFVYATEYTLKTRIQIADAEESSTTRRYRRQLWEVAQEKRQRAAITAAAGVQCNGTPTYEAYRPLNRKAHLYFDTRMRTDRIVAEHDLDTRLASAASGPLRLAFSGRFARMKGVHLLPQLANILRERGVDFLMTVCGDGELRDSVEKEIAERGLGQQVQLVGNLDFSEQLIPFLQSSVDLFVCPHLQGDPSCTYMETFSCGVPIAGFANEAFAGLLDRRRDLGWAAPTGEVEQLANHIERIAQQRHLLAPASRAARELSLEHSFENTVRKRIRHLCLVARPTSSMMLRAVVSDTEDVG